VSEIDTTLSRSLVYKEFKRDPGPCPLCGRALHQSSQSYVVATRQGSQISDSFIIGGNFGWYCPHCPTVVINPKQVSDLLGHGKSDWVIGPEFAVIGIVDWDSIPPENEDIPLGDDNNPIPLIEFTTIPNEDVLDPNRLTGSSKSGSRKKRPKPPRSKAKRGKKKRKRRRN